MKRAPEVRLDAVSGQYNCADCGAFSPVAEDIKHKKGCKPGATEEWRKQLRETSKRLASR